jgi:hypothetical protein
MFDGWRQGRVAPDVGALLPPLVRGQLLADLVLPDRLSELAYRIVCAVMIVA